MDAHCTSPTSGFLLFAVIHVACSSSFVLRSITVAWIYHSLFVYLLGMGIWVVSRILWIKLLWPVSYVCCAHIHFFLCKYLEVELHRIGVCLTLRKCQTAFRSRSCVGYFFKFIKVMGIWSHCRESAVKPVPVIGSLVFLQSQFYSKTLVT